MSYLEIAVAIAAIIVCVVALISAIWGPWIKAQRELADLNARYHGLHAAVTRIENLLDKLKIYLN